MHIKALKVFCDVVSRRSFSRAADENGITQSGASQIVSQLEESLGVKLIDRSKRPFVPTREGQIYYDGCCKIVQRFHALAEEVRTLHHEVAGRVHVASIYSVGLSHMNQLTQQFLTAHPKANLRLEYQHPDRVNELVRTDQVDLGLVSYPKESRSIRAYAWRDEPMVLVCSPQHELVNLPQAGLNDLHGLDLVGFDENLKIRRAIDKVLATQRVDMRLVMEFDNIETIKGAVEINAGVSLLPAPTVAREVEAGTLVARPLVGLDLVRPVGIIHRRGAELGTTAKRFLQFLQTHSGVTLPDSLSRIAQTSVDDISAETSATDKTAKKPAVSVTA